MQAAMGGATEQLMQGLQKKPRQNCVAIVIPSQKPCQDTKKTSLRTPSLHPDCIKCSPMHALLSRNCQIEMPL